MPVTQDVKRFSVSMKLNAGTDPETEKQLTYSVSLGSMSTSADNDGIMAVVNALKPCFNNEVLTTEKTEVYSLSSVG